MHSTARRATEDRPDPAIVKTRLRTILVAGPRPQDAMHGLIRRYGYAPHWMASFRHSLGVERVKRPGSDGKTTLFWCLPHQLTDEEREELERQRAEAEAYRRQRDLEYWVGLRERNRDLFERWPDYVVVRWKGLLRFATREHGDVEPGDYGLPVVVKAKGGREVVRYEVRGFPGEPLLADHRVVFRYSQPVPRRQIGPFFRRLHAFGVQRAAELYQQQEGNGRPRLTVVQGGRA